MRRTPWGLILIGGLALTAIIGCTPKPNQQQLQSLDRTCASATDAERAVESTRRQLSDVERQLGQKRQALAERQRYLDEVRANLQAMQ
jgi:hypothetical protein